VSASLFSVLWFSLLTWAPAALLLLPPNDWYWLVAKVVAGFVLLGVVANLLPPRATPNIGTAGFGFLLNLGLFSALIYFSLPTWMQVVGVLLIAHTMFVCSVIIRRHNEADPLLKRISAAVAQREIPIDARTTTAAHAFIEGAFGRKAEKTANVATAVALAKDQLLLARFAEKEIATLAAALNDGPMPYSTHDLAVSVALGLLKSVPKEARKDMFDVQLKARLTVGTWARQGKVTNLLAQAFERTLYELYHPDRQTE